MLRFRADVRIEFLNHHLAAVFAAACVWSLRARVDVEVNSVNDGAAVHMPGSLHSFDLALDLDTIGDRPADIRRLAEYLRRHLDPGFDVVLESDHVHVEYDARRPPLAKGA